MSISPRIQSIEESATLALAARAAALTAAGEDIISFGAGEPDFPTPPHVVEAAIAAARDPRWHRYTANQGLPTLRAAIAEKTRRDSGWDVDSSQVLVTNGAKQAVYQACAALLGEDDEAIIPSPYWVTYPEVVKLAGARPVGVPAAASRGFRVTVEELEAARTHKTKLLIFSSPVNPTGAVYPPDEIAAIGDWAAHHGLWVLSDEIYEQLVYGSARFASLPVVAPAAESRCVVVNGVAKSHAMTGWRVGWMLGPPEVIAAANNLQSHLSSNVANVAQIAALAALEGGNQATLAMRKAFDRRRLTMLAGLNAIPGISCNEPEGAFYAFPDCRGLLREWRGGRRVETTLELAAILLEEAKLGVVPGEAFGAPGYLRFSYALADELLKVGLQRLATFIAQA